MVIFRHLSLHGKVTDLGAGGVSYVVQLIMFDFFPSIPCWGRQSCCFAAESGSTTKYPSSVSGWWVVHLEDVSTHGRYGCVHLLGRRLGRFVPCGLGSNHGRLLAPGMEQCGHGPSSRPRESGDAAVVSVFFLLLLDILICVLAIFCWTFAAAALHFLLWDQYSCLGLPARADAVDASGSCW